MSTLRVDHASLKILTESLGARLIIINNNNIFVKIVIVINNIFIIIISRSMNVIW